MGTFCCRQPFTDNLWIVESEDESKAINLILEYAKTTYDFNSFNKKMEALKGFCENDGIDLKSYPSYAIDLREYLSKNIDSIKDVFDYKIK